MTENEIAKIAVDVAYRIHTRYGPGMLESVYERPMEYELTKAGLRVRTQVWVPIIHEELEIPTAFRLDIVVEDKVIIETKSLERTTPVHSKQLLTYLRLTDHKLACS